MNNIFFKRILLFSLALLFLSIAYPQSGLPEDNSAKQDIAVKDYSWKTSGRGTVAILEEITLKNLSLNEYKNIEVEVELYTRSGTPVGSLRTTLKEVLPGGSEKTYYNVKLGIMNTDLEDSTARVVRAEDKDSGPISKAGRSILVKDVSFSKASYGTESFIESITLQNTTNQDYKDITLRIGDLGVGGTKVGYEGYVTKSTINKVLPSNSTVTFKDINIGFAHPETKDRYVVVSEATPVSKKELNYLYSEQKDSIKIEESNADLEEKRKLSLVERYREKLKRENIRINSEENAAENGSESGIKFSIEEKVEEEKPSEAKEDKAKLDVSGIPDNEKKIKVSEKGGVDPEFKHNSSSDTGRANSIEKKQPSVDEKPLLNTKNNDNTEDLKAEIRNDTGIKSKNNNNTSVVTDESPVETYPDKRNSGNTGGNGEISEIIDKNTGNSGGEIASSGSGTGEKSSESISSSSSANDSTGGLSEATSSDSEYSDDTFIREEEMPARDYEVAFGEDEVPLPKRDIVVKSFSWGSGVPGTIGKLRKLTLENISSITYTDIDILVEYFAPQGVPLGSSQFILKDAVLNPYETRDFRNIDVGLVQLIPDQSNIKITIRTAKDIY